jgi:hypothetical protein
MSAPIPDVSLSSISSSGHVDGLGRRVLAFDRETGAILERLHLRPELAAFESAIRQQVDQLTAFEDERFARPGSVERDPATGDLTVLAEFVAGSRLSDLLETAEEAGAVPGVDVALGFLLEALPALSTFHAATGCTLGLIDPTRIVITPAAQVVFLDVAFASVVERLALSPARLWAELGIAAPLGQGRVKLDVAADISQLALSAVMLVVGRRLRPDEYPDAIPSLLMEVVEVAQIRGSNVFASSVKRLLQRSLPLPGRRPYGSANELTTEIRLLLRREIGTEVCRQALLDFTDQMDAQCAAARTSADAAPVTSSSAPARGAGSLIGLDLLALETLGSIEVLDDEEPEAERSEPPPDHRESEPAFEEISLDPLFVDESVLPPPPPRLVVPEPVLMVEEPLVARAGTPPPPDPLPEPAIAVEDPWRFDATAADRHLGSTDAAAVPPVPVESPAPQSPVEAVAPPGPAAVVAAGSERAASAQGAEAVPASPESEPTAEDRDDKPEDAAEERGFTSWRRRKRAQKSARARKDKLRSATEKTPEQPKAPPAKPADKSGWLVDPGRAAAFTPPVPQPPPAPAPIAAAPPAPPPLPVYPAPTAIQPAAGVAQPPIAQPPVPAPPIPMPVFGAPPAPPVTPQAPAAPIALQTPRAAPAPVTVASPAATAPLRLKAEPPPGFAPPRRTDSISALPYVRRGSTPNPEPERGFPWKMAIAALLLVGTAIVAGRFYLASKATTQGPTAAESTAPAEPPAVVAVARIETGQIVIETQPPGAKVLLDGKAVGQSPLKLTDVPVGRHTIGLVSSAGAVMRTVRVAAGKTVSLDVSIFSGWVAVYAPIVLDVSVKGKSIGTTEQERLMLPPGRHELTLTNKDLGYRAVQEVQVEPGEVQSVTIDPRGDVNFNAIPWAEVWMDGQKLGETPLANQRVPLGTREFVFKHPQYGERKVTAVVRADQPTAVGVDFTRPE